MAWRNLVGFTRGNPMSNFCNADKERGKQNVHKFGQKDPRDVPDNHRDFHAQVSTLLQEVLPNQKLEEGIRCQFTIIEIKQYKVYHLYFPILFSWVILWNLTNCAAYMVDQSYLCLLHFQLS